MIGFVKSAFNLVFENKREFIYGDNHFIRDSTWSFLDYIEHITFKKRTTLRHGLQSMHKLLHEFGFKKISSSALCQQRKFINPEAFKVISREFLKKIGIKDKKSILKTFKNMRVFAGDGSDLEILNLISTRFDFNVKENKPHYTYPAIAKFSAIVDVMNGYILDGILGDFKEGDLPLAHKNLKNLGDDVIDFPNSIFTFDRGYVGLELNARLTELGANFVIRLRNDVYKEEIANMTSNDEFVKLKLTDSRLEKFHDIELKEKYSKKDYIELRVVKTKVKVIKYDEKTNKEYEEEIDEILLTNFTKEEMSVEDLKEIYKLRWGIEVDFDTLKNRFGIENFSGSIKLTHQQDLYSQFVIFNVYCYINNLLNMKLQRRFVKKYGEEYLDYDFEYKINQANLIRNLLEDFRKIMLLPLRKKRSFFLSELFKESIKDPIKKYKNRRNKHDGKKNNQKNRNNCKPMN